MAGQRNFFASKEQLCQDYQQLQSIYRIADKYNINHKTVMSLMDFYGIKRNNHSIGNRKHFYNESFFKVIDTEEKAYWLGFIMADGCIYKGTDENSFRLQINLASKDEDMLYMFQRTIGSDYKIQHKKISGSEVVILKINSTIMCNDLMNNGVTRRKSLTVQYPSCVPSYLNCHFIRGYFDGDGHIGISKRKDYNGYRYEFCIVGGKDMMESLQDFLPGTRLYFLKNREHIVNLESASKENIIKYYHYMYDSATVFMKRKKDIFEQIINVP